MVEGESGGSEGMGGVGVSGGDERTWAGWGSAASAAEVAAAVVRVEVAAVRVGSRRACACMSVMSVMTGVRTAERVAAPLPTATRPALGGSSDEADSTIDNIVRDGLARSKVALEDLDKVVRMDLAPEMRWKGGLLFFQTKSLSTRRSVIV